MCEFMSLFLDDKWSDNLQNIINILEVNTETSIVSINTLIQSSLVSESPDFPLFVINIVLSTVLILT